MLTLFPHQLFGEFDTLSITGHTVGYWQFPVKDFQCVAATVYTGVSESVTEDDMYTFKVWAENQNDPQLPPMHDNKFWFDLRTCQVEVIHRADW